MYSSIDRISPFSTKPSVADAKLFTNLDEDELVAQSKTNASVRQKHIGDDFKFFELCRTSTLISHSLMGLSSGSVRFQKHYIYWIFGVGESMNINIS